MNQKTLTDKLKSIRREVLAIKTAHAKGLGRIRFYRQVGRWTPSDSSMHTLRLKAVFGNPAATGLTQLGLPTTPGFTFGALLGVDTYPGGAEVTLTASCSDTVAEFTAVSSEFMRTITIEELT